MNCAWTMLNLLVRFQLAVLLSIYNFVSAAIKLLAAFLHWQIYQHTFRE